MSITRSGWRRVTRIVGMGSVSALAVTALTATPALSAPVSASGLECTPLALADKGHGHLIDGWDGIQKDLNNYTAAEIAEMERDFQARLGALGYDPSREQIREPVHIETYFHVVREDRTIEGGNIPRKWIRAQMKYFNHSFRGVGHGAPGARSPFHFHLSGVTRTTNQQWFDDGLTYEAPMKAALREESSTAETLNVYLTNLTNVGLLGYAYLPEDYQQVGYLDGVVVETQSLPGGSADPYNLGGTVSHEVGHWLGLLHTFDGGCSDGDLVEDTPAQSGPTTGCPEGQDTCASEGEDPIHNYMDYSYDACYNQFTIGQRERMIDQWYVYREGVPLSR